jgi:Leucine-rich repeat (LRR) protein
MKLRVLSSTISNARHLTSLVLRSNVLIELPEEIGQLENLKLLDCANNALNALPKSMMNLKNLMTINLSNNKVYCFFLKNFVATNFILL